MSPSARPSPVPGWDGLVTAALLGTDRTPPEDGRGPVGLLDDAARARVLRLAAAPSAPATTNPPPTHVSAPGAGPPAEHPPAEPEPDLAEVPPAARRLLGQLLERPEPDLVNPWLAAAVTRGRRPAPEHWTRLLGVAASTPGYDRGLLAQALGRAGRRFARLLPMAEPLREQLTAADRDPVPEPTAAVAGTPPTRSEVLARPALALEVPAPWPRPVTAAALEVLVSGRLAYAASGYATALGARAAPADLGLVLAAADALPPPARPEPTGVTLVRRAVERAVAAARARAEIEHAFAAETPELPELEPGTPVDDRPAHPEEPR